MSEETSATKHFELVDPEILQFTADRLGITLAQLSVKLGMSTGAVGYMIARNKCKKITALACAALVKDDTKQRIILIPCSKSDVKGLQAYATAVGLKSLEISI